MNKWRRFSLIGLLLLSAILAGTKFLDQYSKDYTEQALQRALISFTVARGLNGLISVIQDAEIAMQPAGVGVTVSPGEILDPINDLIERFSLVMLASATAIGIQQLLLSISVWGYFNWLLIISCLALAAYLVYSTKSNKSIPPFVLKGILLLLIIRFASPVMALSNQLLFTTFMNQDYQQASSSLEQISEQLEKDETNKELDQSLLGQAKQWLDNTSEQLNIKAKIEQYQKAAERASENVVQLITIFLLQTIILPLLFLWLIIRLGKHLLSLTDRKPAF